MEVIWGAGGQRKKGFHYSTLKAWNNMPAVLRELPTSNSFKNNSQHILRARIKTQIPGRSALVYSKNKFLFPMGYFDSVLVG